MGVLLWIICLTAVFTKCRPLLKEGEDDVAFCKRLTVDAGVTALPVRSLLAASPAHSYLMEIGKPHSETDCLQLSRKGLCSLIAICTPLQGMQYLSGWGCARQD